jgi:hypothetical protein
MDGRIRLNAMGADADDCDLDSCLVARRYEAGGTWLACRNPFADSPTNARKIYVIDI